MSDQTTTALPRVPTPPDTRPALTAHPVLADADVLTMGRIRSAQAEHFSNDRAAFDDARQLAWWRANQARVIAMLYADAAGADVGYGCLRQDEDGRWWSSVAVAPGHEGRGHGRTITAHLILSVPFDVWASARTDRPKAQALHNPLLWEVVGADNDLIWYRTRPKVRVARTAMNLDHCGVLGQ